MKKTIRYFSSLPEFKELPVLRDARVGVACCCRCFDGNWRRGVVLSIDGVVVQVRLVDSGNILETYVSELRPLPVVMAQLPPMAIKCSLDGASSLPEGVPLPTQKELLKVLNLQKDLTVTCIDQIGDCLIVRLKDAEGADLNAKLGLHNNVIIVFFHGKFSLIPKNNNILNI